MAHSPSPGCFSYRLLVFWLIVTVAEGQRNRYNPFGVTEPNVNPTDCQIFTLTPPPATRPPVTTSRPVTFTTRWCRFPPFRKPGIPFGFPYHPFRRPNFAHHPNFPPHIHCNHPFSHQARKGFHLHYFPRRQSSRDSSSEEYRRKREVPALLKRI
ncbi:odontogenesis associated phosphoprotein [Trichosurus vulpecula]|uniref:odontogenesis associated phosphoprotein n=1 Tax=Trichosurus vulpecula TaxID=9337 RepID=UPI00186B3A01|nr:odontogenesis associated phosphoprotein [Trichosurus vulpecula]